MTLVRTLQTHPKPDGTRRPAKGFFIWTPTERRIIEGNPDEVVQPAGFAVELNLAGGFEVDVAATGTDWVWRVDERIEGLRTKTTYVVVPPEGPVDFTDLVQVNIASLRPKAVPDHIWYVYTDHLAEQARLAKEAAQASQDAAVESQDSAAISATLADDRADAAGTSAFNAAASAAAALGHKNSAEGFSTQAFGSANDAEVAALAASDSEDAAGISLAAALVARQGSEAARDISVASGNRAETARDEAELALSIVEGIELNQVETGLINESGHLILTKRDDSTVDAGKVILPTRLTVGVVETGVESPYLQGPEGPTGPKGDAGGFVLGTLIPSNMDWNLLTADGIYRFNNVSGNTNKPPADPWGILYVNALYSPATHVVQRYMTISASKGGRVEYQRTLSAGAWTPWRAFNSTRVDQTAGRVIYQWDDLNNRDQLVYGDTGWRDISALCAPGAKFSAFGANQIQVRRINSTVYWRMQNISVTVNGMGAAGDVIFDASSVGTAWLPPRHQMFWWGRDLGELWQSHLLRSGVLKMRNASYMSHNSEAELIWSTDQPWPTSLPGVAGNPSAITNT